MLVRLEDVFDILKELGYLQSDAFILPRVPTHGSCCTCQDCGYGHDECVCNSNELVLSLNAIVEIATEEE